MRLPPRLILAFALFATACGEPMPFRPDTDADGVPDALDCAPDDPTIYPGADDPCDGDDTDCSGVPDDGPGIVHQAVYEDADGDGFVNPDHMQANGCVRDGWLAAPAEVDCDDRKDYANPLAPAYCDWDHDGTIGASDCDDHDAARAPYKLEVCNSIDDDCDTFVDDADPSLSDAGTPFWGIDGDGDGYAAAVVHACESPGPSYVRVASQLDCAPGDSAVHPNQHDACATQTDANCDGVFSSVFGTDAAMFTAAGPTDPPTLVNLAYGGHVELCPGTYRVAILVGFEGGVLGSGWPVEIVGVGASPSDVVLDAAGARANVSVSDYANLDDAGPTHVSLENLTLANGSGTVGGCAYAHSFWGSTLTLTDVDLRGCTASMAGGAVAVDGATFSMTGGSIASASAPIGMGGAFYWVEPSHGAFALTGVDVSAVANDRFAYFSGGNAHVLALADTATLACPGGAGCPP